MEGYGPWINDHMYIYYQMKIDGSKDLNNVCMYVLPNEGDSEAFWAQ
jgi:hypothetical protein